MKKIILILTVLIFAFSCEKEPLPNKGKLDPNAMIVIKPASGVQLRSTVAGLTALEVVEQALAIKWQTHYSDNVYREEGYDISRGFNEQQKDYEIPALKMFGIDIITQDGEYRKDFTNAFNVVITNNKGDTIAYVPDAVINSVRPLIEAAYEDENYTEAYRLFDEAFTFLPIPE